AMNKIPFEVLIHSENALICAKEMDALLIKLIDIPESGDKTYSMTDRRQCGYLCWRLADRPKHWPDTRKANW
ncbi:hypothetical protein D9H26_26640, partial [Escherichia coli]|nr:hypothetical protein [Escherichia coli]